MRVTTAKVSVPAASSALFFVFFMLYSVAFGPWTLLRGVSCVLASIASAVAVSHYSPLLRSNMDVMVPTLDSRTIWWWIPFMLIGIGCWLAWSHWEYGEGAAERGHWLVLSIVGAGLGLPSGPLLRRSEWPLIRVAAGLGPAAVAWGITIRGIVTELTEASVLVAFAVYALAIALAHWIYAAAERDVNRSDRRPATDAKQRIAKPRDPKVP